MGSEHQDVLRRQYATDENLRTRQKIHEQYTIPRTNFIEWVLSCVQWRGDERVLDVGAGPGSYFAPLMKAHPRLQYVGVDLMASMLAQHGGNGQLAQGDVNHLPFPDASFDVVMANHMLYHSPDIPASIAELARVLKPTGVLMAATNSANTMPELQVMMRRAIVLLSKQGAARVRPPTVPSESFSLENGTRLLSKAFYFVARYDLPSALVFSDVEPIMQYLESTRDLRESQLPDDVVWDDAMMIIRQQVNQLIKHLGELSVQKQTGVLIASREGANIAEFLAIQAKS